MMAGNFYAKESLFSPDTCGCVLARDESNPGTDSVVQSSVFVKRCAGHEVADASPLHVMGNCWSKNAAVAALTAELPDDAWTPILREGAVPTRIDGDGRAGWFFSDGDVVGRRLHEPVEFALEIETGHVAVAHRLATPEMMGKVSAALAANPRVNMALADDAAAARAFWRARLRS